MIQSDHNTFITKLSTFKMLILLLALVLPVGVIKIFFQDSSVDPLILYTIISIGFIVGCYLFEKSLKQAIIPYLFLQLIVISIFLDNKVVLISGVNFKIYIMVFGLGVLSAIYYLFNHFRYLWDNFIAFRCLLIFFLINIFYFLFYHSDFRLWYSTYIDIWLASPIVRHLFITQGIDVFSKSFTETKFIGMYLGSFAPIVCLTVALTTLVDLIKPEDIKNRIYLIAKYSTYGFIAYIVIAILLLVTGYSTIGFHNGRLFGDFMGFGYNFPVYLSLYLIFMLGLKYYISINKIHSNALIINQLMNIIIVIFAFLTILQINKSVLIAITVSISLFAGLSYYYGIRFYLFPKIAFQTKLTKIYFYKKLSVIIAFIFIMLLILMNIEIVSNAVSETVYRLEDRFTSFSTFDIRTSLWTYFLSYWYKDLSLFNIVFGHGIDSSREAAFYISSMLAGDIRMFGSPLVHVHNLFLEMFYEYGLIALLYFGAIFSILFDNCKKIISKDSSKNLKLFCLISTSTITYFLIISMSDILRIPIAIILFSLLGFLESAKHAYSNK